MKVFCMNWDGRKERMVAAKSQKAAIEALGTTRYHFSQYASETGNQSDIAIATGHPGAVFEKSFNRDGGWVQIST
jgi:hypothetical protein